MALIAKVAQFWQSTNESMEPWRAPTNIARMRHALTYITHMPTLIDLSVEVLSQQTVKDRTAGLYRNHRREGFRH